MTLRQAISAAADQLAGNKELAPTAMRDPELLLLHTLELPRSTIYAYPGRLLNSREREAYAAAVARRYASEPVQYITGTQEFFGLAMEVGPGVLIPRPETELLVEAVLERVSKDDAITLLDVGTGSGAIAIALASQLPEARVTAIDVSGAALAIARRNVERHGLGGRIRLVQSDLLRELPRPATGFDAIVSNPPYVPEPDRAGMHAEVREHEPEQALFAGADGLEIYRRLIPEASAALSERGLLAMEIGYGQREAVEALLGGWRAVQFLNDLRGIARVVVAWRR